MMSLLGCCVLLLGAATGVWGKTTVEVAHHTGFCDLERTAACARGTSDTDVSVADAKTLPAFSVRPKRTLS